MAQLGPFEVNIGELVGGNKEWGAKIVVLLGVWVVIPQYGNMRFSFGIPFFVLFSLSFMIIFLNKVYDDFVKPLSPEKSKDNARVSNESPEADDGEKVEAAKTKE